MSKICSEITGRRYVLLCVACVGLASVATCVAAQRVRRAAPRINRTAARQAVAKRQSLPKNYGSVRQVQRPIRTRARIQPIADSGSHNTHRGGDVEWRKTDAGQTVVKGKTARGRTYAGAQAVDGARVAAVKAHNGEVVVRKRSGAKEVYRKVGDDWKQVDYVGVPYYYNNYHWYYPYYYGGHVYYHEVYPPTDATVESLPKGAQVVEINGVEYILWDGVYYRKINGQYKVVDPPKAGATARDPLSIIRGMNQFLTGQDTLYVQTEELIAEPAGKGKFTNTRVLREIAMSRPDKMRMRRRESKVPARMFWYDGANATLQTSGQKFYGQVPFSGKLGDLLQMLQNDYAVTLPLSGLFQPGLADNLRNNLKESLYVGLEKTDGRDCHHVQIKTDDVDVDMWIDSLDTAPYPRKVLLRYPNTEGNPKYQARMIKWRVGLTLAKSMFEFVPPKGVRQIEMLPVK